ncbi:MAG: hypothetical protein ACI8Y7_000515 [Candidatus Woesearchaeota archaeon]|jgi:hypothetical protein
MQKRGQAALEYMGTYGWAFLTITIMVGSLAYLGIFDQSNLVPERCYSEFGFSCVDYGWRPNYVNTNDVLIMTIVNGKTNPIEIDYFADVDALNDVLTLDSNSCTPVNMYIVTPDGRFSLIDSTEGTPMGDVPNFAQSVTIKGSNKFNVVIECQNKIEQNSFVKIKTTLHYREFGKSYARDMGIQALVKT